MLPPGCAKTAGRRGSAPRAKPHRLTTKHTFAQAPRGKTGHTGHTAHAVDERVAASPRPAPAHSRLHPAPFALPTPPVGAAPLAAWPGPRLAAPPAPTADATHAPAAHLFDTSLDGHIVN